MSATLEAMVSVVARPRSRREAWLLAVIAALVTAIVGALAIQPWLVGVFQDDGIYTILGKAIASGHGYRYLNLPGAPAATHYPPAYPLVLALLWRVAPEFPANTALFVFTNVLFLALAALGAWAFAYRRLRLGPSLALLVVLATVACIPAIVFGVYVLSEPMFMASVFPVLLFAERAVDGSSRRDAFLAGLLAGALAMVRTTGEFAIVALVVVLLWRRRWLQAALACAAASLFVVPWQLWVTAHGGDIPPVLVGKYGSYAGWLAHAVVQHGPIFEVRVIGKNLQELHALAWAMFTGADPAHGIVQQVLAALLSASLLGLFALGTRSLRRRAPVSFVFLIVYTAVVMLWPFEPTRFLWAILPLFGFLFAMGAVRAMTWRPRRSGLARLPVAARVVVALFLVGYAAYNVRATRERWWTSVPETNSERAAPLAKWAREHTRPGDLLATDDDALIHLYTGRRTIPVGTFTPEEYLVPQTYDFATGVLETLLDTYHPRWVMCSTSYCAMAARNLSERQPPRLRFLGALERGAVFEPVAP